MSGPPAVPPRRFQRRAALVAILPANHVFQCELVEGRLALVSLDAPTGDYVELRLFGGGRELASESVYEDYGEQPTPAVSASR